MKSGRLVRGSRSSARRRIAWLCVLAGAIGVAAIVRTDIALRRSAFQAEAQMAHRVLSQATSRLDAVLGTLVLMARPAEGDASEASAAARLPAVYPQVLAAWRRESSAAWPDEIGTSLAAAESRSRALPAAERHAAVAAVDGARGRYALVLAGEPASFALRIDAARLVPAGEWPWPAGAPVRATLTQDGQQIVLQDEGGASERPFGLTDGFDFTKTLASPSQPFVLQAQRFTGPAQWPWPWLALWVAACAALYSVATRWLAVRAEQRRAEEQVRLAQASRLNTLGELAAGVAHELNQPLTAVLASTQTALRLLREGPEHGDREERDDTVVQALELAGAQGRRAAEVVARLRRLVQHAGGPVAAVTTDVGGIARRIAAVLARELDQAGIAVAIEGRAPPALADPVAVEQILHNLLGNAMQALEGGRRGSGRITVTLSGSAGRVRCAVGDNGPGIAPEAVPRLFEPFFTTRRGGLGLGLPLCQTLATAMDGHVELRRTSAAGTEFVLDLPAASHEHRDRRVVP